MSDYVSKDKLIDRTSSGPSHTKRQIYFVLGWMSLITGIAGIILPAMPGTVFLICALWFFSRSSPKMRHWLLNHPKFGQALKNWETHRIIPLRAKYLSSAMMMASLIVLCLIKGFVPLTFCIMTVLFMVGIFIWSCPSERAKKSHCLFKST